MGFRFRPDDRICCKARIQPLDVGPGTAGILKGRGFVVNGVHGGIEAGFRRRRGTTQGVMKCHVLSCDVMVQPPLSSLRPGWRKGTCGGRGDRGEAAPASRTQGPLQPDVMKCHVLSCGGLSRRPTRPGLRRRASALRPVSPPGRGGSRLRPSVPPSRQRAGRGVPVSRAIARACARGRGRAFRGGAVRARDCPRETAHAPRPSVPAGVFFAAPASRFLQKRRKAAPGEPPLSTFILHHIA